MASFAQTLRFFRSGELPLDDFLQEVDQILGDGRASPRWMFTTLSEHNKDDPLPSDVYQAVMHRIESAAQKRGELLQEYERTPKGEADEVAESSGRTATYVSGDASLAASDRNGEAQSADGRIHGTGNDEERIKGTGDVLNGRFELKECLGTGGMSAVYLALDRRKLEANDRHPYVAVKILNLEFRAHPDSLIALQREAKKCQSLSHPNIVTVYDFDRDGSTVYMTMEHLSGSPLSRHVGSSSAKRMVSKEALRIINDMGQALAFAHHRGIVHADFKPANVFVTDSGEVKVIDFGIARAFQRPDETVAQVTRFDPGSLGAMTPAYASPEMLEFEEPDPRDDVYGLACTAYELLTGKHPFGRMQATAARDAGVQLRRREGLTRRQWRAVRNGLEFERNKRTPSVARFLQELNTQGPTPRQMAIGGGVVALTMLVGGSIGYYLSGNGDKWGPSSPGGVESPVEQLPELPGTYVADQASTDTDLPVPDVAVAPSPASEPPPQPRPVARPTPKPPSLAAIIPVLDDVECALLQPVILENTVELRGYARERDVPQVEAEIAALDGVSEVNTNTVAIGDEQCDALQVLSPYLAATRESGRGASIGTGKPDDRFVEGEDLVLNITAPPVPSYVTVDYYSLDGGVVHMVPNPQTPPVQVPANYEATIGELGEWGVAQPFGTEMIVILTTPEPLFDKLGNEYESQTSYLPKLSRRLDELKGRFGPERIAADLVLIKTSPKPTAPSG